MKIKKYIFLILVIGCVLAVPGPEDLQYLAGNLVEPLVLVIDAGHGGPDGGAEAADGTKEKDLNLIIAQALQKEAENKGFRVIMTRTSDDGLYEQNNLEKQWTKVGDIKERKRIIDESGADMVISVHMNSFWPDTNVRGAQVFYPKTGEETLRKTSEGLAKQIQQSLIETLDDGSNRIAMTKDDIYLFQNITVPTVLVECGFLSNGQDLDRLKQKEMQAKMAKGIVAGLFTSK